jgi:hypothetical protein
MSQYGLAEFLREMTRMVDIVESDCGRVIEAECMVGKLVQQSEWLAPEKRRPRRDTPAIPTMERTQRLRSTCMASNCKASGSPRIGMSTMCGISICRSYTTT